MKTVGSTTHNLADPLTNQEEQNELIKPRNENAAILQAVLHQVYIIVKIEKESKELDSVTTIIFLHLELFYDSHVLGQFFSQ